MDHLYARLVCFFFFQAEDGIRDYKVTGVQTCALPIYLITREFGSWVFIGELLLNLELEPEETGVADQCGSCTLCIDACPTGAIVEPYVLDANLCISHATIESRATEIRADVARHLEGWFYGCDICQDVCPWNQMTSVTTDPRFQPRPENVNASLSEIQ